MQNATQPLKSQSQVQPSKTEQGQQSSSNQADDSLKAVTKEQLLKYIQQQAAEISALQLKDDNIFRIELLSKLALINQSLIAIGQTINNLKENKEQEKE